MAHEKAYLVCENMCMVEGISKEDFKVIHGSFLIPTTETSIIYNKTIDYPEGFDIDNSFVVGFNCAVLGGSQGAPNISFYGNNEVSFDEEGEGDKQFNIYLKNDKIYISISNPNQTHYPTDRIYYTIILMNLSTKIPG